MPAAVDLLDAAQKTADNLFPLWEAGTLKFFVGQFWQAITGSFVEDTPNDRPIGDWIALIAGFQSQIQGFDPTQLANNGTSTSYQTIESYVYRLFKFAYTYGTVEGKLTSAQQTVLLNAYNTYLV
jgi:hypothetical protein